MAGEVPESADITHLFPDEPGILDGDDATTTAAGSGDGETTTAAGDGDDATTTAGGDGNDATTTAAGDGDDATTTKKPKDSKRMQI